MREALAKETQRVVAVYQAAMTHPCPGCGARRGQGWFTDDTEPGYLYLVDGVWPRIRQFKTQRAHDVRLEAGAAGPAESAGAPVVPGPGAWPDDGDEVFGRADRELGIGRADEVRAVLDACVTAAIDTAMTDGFWCGWDSFDRTVEDVGHGLGLVVDRVAGRNGFSVWVAGERLPASAFERDYSGPAIMRRFDQALTAMPEPS